MLYTRIRPRRRAPSAPLLDELFQLEASEHCTTNCTLAQGRLALSHRYTLSIALPWRAVMSNCTKRWMALTSAKKASTIGSRFPVWRFLHGFKYFYSIELEYPFHVPIDDRVGFYIKATDNITLLGLHHIDSKSSPDMNKVKLAIGSAVFDISTSTGRYSWNGGITYYKDMGERENLAELNSFDETMT